MGDRCNAVRRRVRRGDLDPAVVFLDARPARQPRADPRPRSPRRSRPQTAAERWSAYLLGFVAISAGWFLVHTIYTFRYAHLYWHDEAGGPACGGIHFPGTDEPSDYDFAYFSFALGTSFAVSDPQVTETRVRREVMVHSIISFAYNSVIIGMVINLFAGIFAELAGAPK